MNRVSNMLPATTQAGLLFAACDRTPENPAEREALSGAGHQVARRMTVEDEGPQPEDDSRLDPQQRPVPLATVVVVHLALPGSSHRPARLSFPDNPRRPEARVMCVRDVRHPAHSASRYRGVPGNLVRT